jgi:hypothetical protein
MGGGKAIGPRITAWGRAVCDLARPLRSSLRLRLRRLSLAPGLAAVLACTGSVPAMARTDDVRQLARSLARQIAAPWPDRQAKNGHLRDDIAGVSNYGDAVMGYALLDEGLRERDPRIVTTGLRAIRFATSRGSLPNDATSVFQNMAVGFAYNLAQQKLRRDGRWTKIRHTVESFIRRQGLVRLNPHPDHFANHLLVESLVVFNYIHTGVTSSSSHSIVGPGRGKTYAFTRRFIQSGVPRLFDSSVVTSGGDRTVLFSDPPDDPLAYQGLSIGLYARAAAMLGRSAGGAAATVLERALEASWRLTAPDGDMSYFGRNQEEAWTLAAAAYGARQAERLPGTPDSRRARYESVARRALERIRDVHLGGPAGIYILPVTRQSVKRTRSIMEGGGGQAPFGGLALMFLDFLADGGLHPGPGPGRIRSDSGGASVLGQGDSLLATQRVGDVWMAVRGKPSDQRPDDIRYDAGLVALKRRLPDGGWVDLVTRRPPFPAHGPDSAGPVLRNGSGGAGFAASRIEAHGHDGLTAVGGYRTIWGSPGIRRSGDVRYRPLDCGVDVSFRVRSGDHAEYSVFLRDSGRHSGHGTVTSGGTTVTSKPAAHLRVEPGWISSLDARVLRARFSWSAHSSQRIHVRICGPS